MTARLERVLADAAWMTPDRARAYATIFASVAAVIIIAAVILSDSGILPNGQPLGTDFVCFWTASRLALAGHAAEVFDQTRFWAFQRELFHEGDGGFWPFLYPPTYLVLITPLALLPYTPSIVAWLMLTGLFCWSILDRLLPKFGWLLLAYPATLLNAGHGQNALLTTGLLGAGITTMGSSPIVAGLCFGMLTLKPQLGLLIPVLLIATGRWQTVAVAGATAAVLVALSWIVFGVEVWQAFVSALPLTSQLFVGDTVGHARMVSPFAALALLGVPTRAAMLVQLVVTVVLAILVVRSRDRGLAMQGAVLVTATVLASPYLLDYDLLMLALPMAWLLSRAWVSGWLPYEKMVLMMSFLMPLLARPVATFLGIPIAPFIVTALLVVIWRRGRVEACRMNLR